MGFRSLTHNEAQASASLAVTRPAGAVAGDYLIAFVRSQDTAPALTPPAGWTVQQQATIGSSPVSRFAICTADGAVAALTFNFADATADWSIDVLCYTGVSGVDGSSIAAGSTSSGTTIGVGGGVTTTTPLSVLVCGWSARQGSGPTTTPPAGMTQRTDDNFPTILSTADQAFGGPGATGPFTATMSNANLNRMGGMVALIDASGGGSTPIDPMAMGRFCSSLGGSF